MKPHLKAFFLSLTLAIASWYSYTGTTANGEKFNGRGYTAASTTLPFGTIVKVQRVNDGRFVVVRINDRGPFITGRAIDLTKEAFRKIGDLDEGLAEVKITIIKHAEGSHNR